jgi:ribosomal protein S18 acetylase RimI-like enzyme
MDGFVIREFIPEQNSEESARLLPAFLRIWNAPENLPFVSRTMCPCTDCQVRDWLERHLERGVRYFAVLDADGEIRAILMTRADHCTGFEFLNLGVQPDYKRQGIGRMMVRHTMHMAAQEGYQAVEGDIFADDIPMLRLALELGFIPVRMEHGARADGMAMVRMKRKL